MPRGYLAKSMRKVFCCVRLCCVASNLSHASPAPIQHGRCSHFPRGRGYVATGSFCPANHASTRNLGPGTRPITASTRLLTGGDCRVSALHQGTHADQRTILLGWQQAGRRQGGSGNSGRRHQDFGKCLGNKSRTGQKCLGCTSSAMCHFKNQAYTHRHSTRRAQALQPTPRTPSDLTRHSMSTL